MKLDIQLSIYRLAYKQADDKAENAAIRQQRNAAIDAAAYEEAANVARSGASPRDINTTIAKRAGQDVWKHAINHQNLGWAVPVGIGGGLLSWLFGSKPRKAVGYGIGAAALTAGIQAARNANHTDPNANGMTLWEKLRYHKGVARHVPVHRVAQPIADKATPDYAKGSWMKQKQKPVYVPTTSPPLHGPTVQNAQQIAK